MFKLRALDTSRLTANDRRFAAAFAETLPQVIEPAPGDEVSAPDLAHALRKAAGQGFPVSSTRRLAAAVGFRVRNADGEAFIRDVRLA